MTGPRPAPVDVVVVGAGPAGSVAALQLARRGARAALVEAGRRRRPRIGESLPPEAMPVLDRLGLLQTFRGAGHLPSHANRAAWGTAELAEAPFIFSPYGHGWHIDRAAFDEMLVCAAQQAGAAYVQADQVAWQPAPGPGQGGCLYLERAGTRRAPAPPIHARWVLDCTGRAAAIAQRLGARRVHHDRLVAVAAMHTPRLAGDVDSTTTIESVHYGWWYTALLPNGNRIFVYLSDGDLLNVTVTRTAEAWMRLLAATRHMGRLHEQFEYQAVGSPSLVSAATGQLSAAVGPGWVAAGDAAISSDPLAGQGIVTALASGHAAADAILAHEAGDNEALIRFQLSIDALGRDYLTRRRHYYGLERRWSSSPFWQRRQPL